METTTGAVRLAGALPKEDDVNGLQALATRLVHDPGQVLCVVVADVASLKTDLDSGEVIPTLRLRLVEPVLREEDSNLLLDLARRAHADRTGQTVLPLDLEQQVRDALGDQGD